MKLLLWLNDALSVLMGFQNIVTFRMNSQRLNEDKVPFLGLLV